LTLVQLDTKCHSIRYPATKHIHDYEYVTSEYVYIRTPGWFRN